MKQLSIFCAGFCLFLCLLFYGSCDDDGGELPPLTMGGKNTFGCLVNGKIWLPKSQALGQPSTDADYSSGKFMSFGSSNDDSDFQFIISNPIEVNTEYSLTDTARSRAFYGQGKDMSYCVYEDYNVVSGSVVFKKFDLNNQILSGTFEFTTYNPDCGDTIKVTDGRFDIGDIVY